MIIEGRQGEGKSTTLRTLTPPIPGAFCDTSFELGNKEAFVNLPGRFIIEMAELDGLSRAESSRAKAFFSSQVDSYRPPYGRETVSIPRQCIFVGTVNGNEYLRDETGGRRYHPVHCTKINIAEIERDRDMLWAEAVARFKAGERLWPQTTEEHALCGEQQEMRAETDAWTSLITDFFDTEEFKLLMAARANASHPNGYMQTDDVFARILKVPSAHWDRFGAQRIGKIFITLKWAKRKIGSKNIYIPHPKDMK